MEPLNDVVKPALFKTLMMGLLGLYLHHIFQRLTLLADFQLAIAVGLLPSKMSSIKESLGIWILVLHLL